jgi:hypothetical protein
VAAVKGQMNVGVDEPWSQEFSRGVERARPQGYGSRGPGTDLGDAVVPDHDDGVRERWTAVSIDYGATDDGEGRVLRSGARGGSHEGDNESGFWSHGRAVYPTWVKGWSISQNILKRHSGEILVESLPGKGSRFIVRFPTNLLESMRSPIQDRGAASR